MSDARPDRSSTRRRPGALSPPWRRAAAALFPAIAVALLPAAGLATTANDLCGPQVDPCRVAENVSVTSGSEIDFGTRRLVIATRGTLDLDSVTMTVRAGQFIVESGGSLQARGTAQDPGGKITVLAGVITINGNVDATGAPGGVVVLTSTGPLTVAGPLDVRSRGSENGGGSAELRGTAVTISARINALGGGEDFGGDVQIDATDEVTLNGDITASGGEGGTIDITTDGAVTIGTDVSLNADAAAGGGSGGEITISATNAVTVNGNLTATGRNGSADTGAGDGGSITILGGSINIPVTAARIDASAGGPDGVGGDVDLTSDTGRIDCQGRLDARGPGVEGVGGSVTIDSTGAASIGGIVDASGGRDGGGDIDIASASDLTMTATASLTVEATSSGDGGDIDAAAGGRATILGTLVSDGGPTQGSTGGAITVSACTVRIESSGRLTSLRSGGTNTLIGGDLTVVAGTLRADAGSGRNEIRFAGPDYEPAILPGAQVVPGASLMQDPAVVPCNPVNTRTPTNTRTVGVMTPTRTVGVTPTRTVGMTPSATATGPQPPTPTVTPGACVGDCDDSGTVVISDLIIGVNIALDNQPASNCPAFDPDGSETVTINELIQGVNNALSRCP